LLEELEEFRLEALLKRKDMSMNPISRRSLLSGMLTASIAGLAMSLTNTEADAQQRRGSSNHPNRRPPPLRHERRPPPRRGFVWSPGYWAWDHRRRDYVWVPGRWIHTRPGFHHRGPSWSFQSGVWVFHSGGWR
jgi:WXXGXW repeat (2 copies)